MKVKVFDQVNAVIEEIDLSDDVFAVTPRKDIISRVVLWPLAKRRSGSHNVKGKSDVHGTTRKMYKQKGTGGARHGSRKAAQFRGAGVVFGPVNRDHGYSLPKKIRKSALRMALSAKIANGQLIIVDSLSYDKPITTKEFLKRFANDCRILFVDETKQRNTLCGLSNIVGFDYLPQIGLNVYDTIRKDKIVITKNAVKLVEERLL